MITTITEQIEAVKEQETKIMSEIEKAKKPETAEETIKNELDRVEAEIEKSKERD